MFIFCLSVSSAGGGKKGGGGKSGGKDGKGAPSSEFRVPTHKVLDQ